MIVLFFRSLENKVMRLNCHGIVQARDYHYDTAAFSVYQLKLGVGEFFAVPSRFSWKNLVKNVTIAQRWSKLAEPTAREFLVKKI